MPDLTISYYWQCQSVESADYEIPSRRKGSSPYTVSLRPYMADMAGYDEYGWYCTCQGFRFHGKKCDHVKQAKLKHCGWQEFLTGGQVGGVEGDRRCPKCNAAAVSRPWGV